MIVFLEFAGITVVAFGLLLIAMNWISQRNTGWRNTAAFVVGLGAAYAASFALDLFFGSLFGAYTFKPYVLPVFIWTIYAALLHFLARVAAAGPNPIRLAYLVIGSAALVGGFVGTHKHDFAVGFACMTASITCFRYPLAAYRIARQ